MVVLSPEDRLMGSSPSQQVKESLQAESGCVQRASPAAHVRVSDAKEPLRSGTVTSPDRDSMSRSGWQRQFATVHSTRLFPAKPCGSWSRGPQTEHTPRLLGRENEWNSLEPAADPPWRGAQ